MLSVITYVALAAVLSAATPVNPVVEARVTAAPEGDAVKRATSCTFSGSSGYASASKSQASCSTIVLSNVAVPSGVTLDLSDMNDGTHVIFEGKTTWGYAEWEGPLLQIKGNEITVEGADGSYLEGGGAQYWDGEGSGGGVTKPKFFYAHDLTSSSIINLHIQNTPVHAVSISGCTDLTITDMTIDDQAGDDGGGHNTDGFDIGESTGVTITGANVYNQDDCVAVNSGSDITFSGGTCSGGHGLSIGSVGGRDDNVVENVTFENNVVKNSVNGIRIKTTVDDTGSVTGVTYKEITLQSISKYGILIEQNYDGGDLHGDPTSGIPITDLTVENISGSGAVDSDGYDIVITCGSSSSCSDWTWSDVVVTGGKTYSDCSSVPSVVGGCS